jgi:uncharacterized membrane protein
MNVSLVMLVAFGMGFVSGLRAFTPLALVSWLAVWGWIPLGDSRLAFLGTNTGAVIVTILAVGELIGDKWPGVPSRTAAAPLGGRVITGALSATAICLAAGQPWLLGVFSGAIGPAIKHPGFYPRSSGRLGDVRWHFAALRRFVHEALRF